MFIKKRNNILIFIFFLAFLYLAKQFLFPSIVIENNTNQTIEIEYIYTKKSLKLANKELTHYLKSPKSIPAGESTQFDSKLMKSVLSFSFHVFKDEENSYIYSSKLKSQFGKKGFCRAKLVVLPESTEFKMISFPFCLQKFRLVN